MKIILNIPDPPVARGDFYAVQWRLGQYIVQVHACVASGAWQADPTGSAHAGGAAWSIVAVVQATVAGVPERPGSLVVFGEEQWKEQAPFRVDFGGETILPDSAENIHERLSAWEKRA